MAKFLPLSTTQIGNLIFYCCSMREKIKLEPSLELQLNLFLAVSLRIINPVKFNDNLFDMDTLLVGNYYSQGEYLYDITDIVNNSVSSNMVAANTYLLPKNTKIEIDQTVSPDYYIARFYLVGYPPFETKLHLKDNKYSISYCIACLEFVKQLMMITQDR